MNKGLRNVIYILFLLMGRLFGGADTTARIRGQKAGATPEAAAQINRDDGVDGTPANLEGENDGKNGIR
ncbi:hypothetical protein ACVGXC_03025, partial [Enterobacter hormaechei]